MTANPPPDTAALTEALHKSGTLSRGRVQDVTVISDRQMLLSRILRLGLTYDHPDTGGPATIILKTVSPTATDEIKRQGEREIAFYTQIAPGLSGIAVPACFGTSWNPDTLDWHLLLEDLTDSHAVPTAWPLPPSQAQCEVILAARARLHAVWWDDPRLGESIGRWIGGEDAVRSRRFIRTAFDAFADRLGDNLSAKRRALIQRVLDAQPKLAVRYRTHRNMTVCHGDAHVWNCFLPKDGSGDVRFFDWDSWRLHVAAIDLAYMMALHWFPERRQRMEHELLDHYHNVLVSHGVTGYDRQALQDDYRWAVLWQLLVPIWQAAHDLPPIVWWSHLERILMAIDDLGCRELLD